uniref:Uncharacterized protein n=1 Tax=Oryza brachyantha TaxID=4533 RepID=J3LNR2_ORYBR
MVEVLNTREDSMMPRWLKAWFDHEAVGRMHSEGGVMHDIVLDQMQHQIQIEPHWVIKKFSYKLHTLFFIYSV